MKVDARRIIERREAERAALLDRAARFARDLGPDLWVLGAVVFGSVARGDFNVWSDVDVLVVVANADDGVVDRVRSAGRDVGLVEPVVWTPEHLGSRLKRQDPIAVESVERGVWLIGSAAELLAPADHPRPGHRPPVA